MEKWSKFRPRSVCHLHVAAGCVDPVKYQWRNEFHRAKCVCVQIIQLEGGDQFEMID